MADLKPIGSEKLTGDEKLKRILELTYFNENNKKSSSTKVELVKEAKSGTFYGIVKEKDGYYVKKGLNESSLDYIGGMFMKNKNKFLFVGGVRVNRKDGKHRLWASSIAKYSRLLLLKDNHPDSGCGIKVFHKDLFLRLPYFDHMHRFLSALAHREGAKILEFNVKHRERQIGVSNYTNLGRLIVGISDMLGVIWLRKRMPKNKVSEEIYK